MRTEDKVMINGKLQAKKDRLKSLPCPSPQSSLSSSRASSLSSKFSSLCFCTPASISDQSAKSPPFNPRQSEHPATRSPQHLFIEVSAGLLCQGQSVRFCAFGQSMHPTIKEGETITVVPVALSDIRKGDILFYKLGKKVVAHRLISIKKEKNNSASHSSGNSLNHCSIQPAAHSSRLNPQRLFILRGDRSLTCDEPVETHQILGKVVSVEKRGRSLDLYSRKARIFRFGYAWTSCLKRLILHALKVYQKVELTLGGLR
jgi:hypothetical protein